jgi:hypothetical protein
MKRPTQSITCLYLLASVLLGFTVTSQAFDDDKQQIAKQLKTHEQAVTQTLTGFRKGDEERQQSAQANIAASEGYLSVLNFRGDDPRLVGQLFDEHLAASPANVGGFSSRVFHYRLQQRTGFVVDFDAITDSKALSDAKAK